MIFLSYTWTAFKKPRRGKYKLLRTILPPPRFLQSADSAQTSYTELEDSKELISGLNAPTFLTSLG